jgi:glyoxylase-like metal-dependent hydrolase (beta-lactamase superfamily II)
MGKCEQHPNIRQINMKRRILILIITLIPICGFSVDIDTITSKIIVLNEGYDRVSAIKTLEGIVIIDTHKSTADMSRMKKLIINHFNDSNFVYVINTHPCLEHINGNSLFPNAKKIAHSNFADTEKPDSNDNRIGFINKNIPQLEDKILTTTDTSEKQELQKRLDYLAAMRDDFFKSALPPDLSFTDRLSIKVGDLTFEMVYIGDGAHGNSSIFIYIPEEKTLFTGSALAMPPIIYKTGGWITNHDVDRWISVLNEYIGKSDLENIVASHIKYYTKKDLTEMRDYYSLISSTIRENQTKGLTKDETFAILDYNSINKRFEIFDDNEKSKDRHENNIMILWDYYKNTSP